MASEAQLKLRIRSLRRSEETYEQHVTSNKSELDRIRRDRVRAEEELIQMQQERLRRRPISHAQVRQDAAVIIYSLLDRSTDRRIRKLKVSHNNVGPLGGTSSQVSCELEDIQGRWHAVVANIYTGDIPVERWSEEHGYDEVY